MIMIVTKLVLGIVDEAGSIEQAGKRYYRSASFFTVGPDGDVCGSTKKFPKI